ncbi:MAG: winged helix-turn-helix transcriptional regulator [Hyphomonadaceae bacterium]|nr:winged helix-turn-helix transcriptional regulator [Hyphomonadaceae bacterium]
MSAKRAPARRPSLDKTLAALADPHRRRTIDVLRRGPRRAGELAEMTGLTPPAMSRHLRTLRSAGLVEEAHANFDARVRVYALKSKPIAELRAWLEETEKLWGSQLTSLKSYIERGA